MVGDGRESSAPREGRGVGRGREGGRGGEGRGGGGERRDLQHNVSDLNPKPKAKA